MSRKWGPGDVALVRNEWDVWNVAICAVRPGHRGFVWVYGVSDAFSPLSAEARPLVVIDPEDAEQVERLWRIWTDLAPDHRLAQDNMQAALREYVDPPKEPEPLGLGAVVEADDEGLKWTRIDDAGGTPWCNGTRFPKSWQDLDVVRVLSEGVEA